MAENLQKSDNSQKIACRSRQAVNFKSRIIVESLKDSLDKNEERTEQGRRLYLQKFEEIYEKISQENIEVNGEALETATADTTPGEILDLLSFSLTN
ncbi:hypothetical protein V1264_019641 [Littorina saxatilis]|uniref:Uncharacterized protein n=1 Tax=Littorina saxatilis TaxID=31220 RepID=A0AAN9GE86_9CAEN